MKNWSTPFTQAFGCRLPIVGAPMADVSGGLLAAEVTRAGGLGFIAAGHLQDLSELENQIKIFNDRAPNPNNNLAIGFIGFSSLATPTGWKNYEHILRTYKPSVVQFFAPSIIKNQNGTTNVELARRNGSKFIAQVGSIKEAKVAIAHKVDAIICQGREAGGHGLRRELGNSAMALASQTAQLTKDIPILAAGGFVHGKHVASALCYCDGVSMGTRFWACKESIGNQKLQQELLKDNSCDDVVRTRVFDQIHNELSKIKWPKPYDSSGVLRNGTTEKWDCENPDRLLNAIEGLIIGDDISEQYKRARKLSDASILCNYSGEGVGEVHAIEGACNALMRIEKEAADAIDRLKSL